MTTYGTTDFAPEHAALIESITAGAGSRIVDEVVDYEHDGTPLKGYFVHDEAMDQPKPAVLIVHDWTGLREYPKARAHMLARLGYAAFAVDVYGRGVRPTAQQDAQAEAGKYYGNLPLLRARVRAAYDLLADDDRVDSDRIVVIGYCFGGAAALEFARTATSTGAPLAGVVSFHGFLNAHEPAEVDALPPVLVLHGAADEVVPDEQVIGFQNELRTRAELDWQVHTYSGAPHAFTLPGTPAYREAADRRSWRELVAFLDEVFGAPGGGALV